MAYNDCIERVQETFIKMKEVEELLQGGPSSFYFEKMDAYVEVLFERFAPFKKGDRIKLSKTPEITLDKSWGWMGSKHFLVKGAKGTVQAVDLDARNKKFYAEVVFDNESWKNSNDGVVTLYDKDKRHNYAFGEDYIKLLK